MFLLPKRVDVFFKTRSTSRA